MAGSRMCQMMLFLLVATVAGTHRAAAARQLLSTQDNVFAGQAAALRDIAHQERSETMATHISRAVAAGGAAEVVGHATGRITRAGDDTPRTIAGHVDRRLRFTARRLAAWALQGVLSAQENMGPTTFALQEPLRQEMAADMSARVKAAVGAGRERAALRFTSAADLGNRRRRLQLRQQ